jgi:hypothetical protein
LGDAELLPNCNSHENRPHGRAYIKQALCGKIRTKLTGKDSGKGI